MSLPHSALMAYVQSSYKNTTATTTTHKYVARTHLRHIYTTTTLPACTTKWGDFQLKTEPDALHSLKLIPITSYVDQIKHEYLEALHDRKQLCVLALPVVGQQS